MMVGDPAVDVVHATQGLVLRTYDTVADAWSLADDWNALAARCATGWTYFQQADWCLSWLTNFARDASVVPVIQTAWRGNRLVALWPLMVMRQPGLTRLVPLGHPHTQYCDMLVERQFVSKAEIERVVAAALAAQRHDVAILPAIAPDSVLAHPLSRRAEGYAVADTVCSFQLDLTKWDSAESYTASLSKLQKRNRNRRRNHLGRLGTLNFEVLWPGDAGFAENIAQAVAYKRDWLAASRRISVGLGQRGVEEFLGGLSGDRQVLEGACLSVLRLDEKPIAIELGFLTQRHYYAYLGAFDATLSAHSPGKVQMDMTVSWLIESGVGCYDLLANEADYKQAWSNKTEQLTSATLPVTTAGRLYAHAWMGRLRPALKAGYAAMPEVMRRVLAIGQGVGCIVLYV